MKWFNDSLIVSLESTRNEPPLIDCIRSTWKEDCILGYLHPEGWDSSPTSCLRRLSEEEDWEARPTGSAVTVSPQLGVGTTMWGRGRIELEFEVEDEDEYTDGECNTLGFVLEAGRGVGSRSDGGDHPLLRLYLMKRMKSQWRNRKQFLSGG